MRHGNGTPGRRLRNNRNNNGRRSGGGGGGGNNRNQVFDSNGPDVRIRGTAHQIQEKYATLAKDSASVGDLIMAESYLQHAEHYQRVINSWGEQMGQSWQQQQQDQDEAGEEENHGPNRRFDMRPAARPQHSQPQPQDDLGLPASILGEQPVVRQQERQTELADA